MDYQNFATLGVNLNRQKYGPLDISSVFTSTADLTYYITKGKTKQTGLSSYWANTTPYPYEGQLVALNENGKVSILKLVTNGDSFNAEDITAAVQNDLNQFRTETVNDIISLGGQISDINNKINNLPDTPDLTGYATKAYVNNAVTSAEQNMQSELYGEVELLNGSIDALGADMELRVPKSRTINGYSLSANITLDAEDVEADPEGTAAAKASEALAQAKTYTNTYALPKTTTVNGQESNSANNYIIEASHISLTTQDTENAAKLNVETYLNYLDSEIKNVAIGSEFLPRDTVINNVKFIPGYSNSEGTFPPSYTLDATHIPVFDRGFSVSDYLSASLDNLRLNDTDGNGLAIVYSRNNSDEETFLRPFDNYPLKKAANALGAVRMETAKAEGLRDPNDLDSELYQMPKGAMAIGNETIASGIASFSTGINSEANGSGAFAGNYGTTATGDYSTALGRDTTASAMAAFATGDTNTASGFASFVAGSNNEASGYVSSVLGYNNKATAYYSHAEGCGTIAASTAQHVQGQFNIEDNAGKYAHIVGWGNAYARANIHTLETNGNAWFAGTGKFEGEVYSGNKKLATSEQVATLYTDLASVIDSHKTLIDSKADASALANYVLTSRTINNKALTNNISLSYLDVGADAAGTALGYYNTLNNKIDNIDLSGYVPTSRTINSKALTNNISLTYLDVGADKSGSAATAESNAKSYADSNFLLKTATVNGVSFTNGKANINAHQIRTLQENQPDSDIANNKLTVALYLNTLDSEVGFIKQDLVTKLAVSTPINNVTPTTTDGSNYTYTLTANDIQATIAKASTSDSTETFPITKSLTHFINGSFRKVEVNAANRGMIFESWNGTRTSITIPGSSLSYLLNGEINEGAVKMTTACEEGYDITGAFNGDYAVGYASMALGDNTQAAGTASLAIGQKTQAGYYTVSGGTVTPSGVAAFAAGIETRAKADASVAIGLGTTAASANSFVSGYYNKSDSTGTYLHIVGNGLGPDAMNSTLSYRNAYTLDNVGNAFFRGRVQVGNHTTTEHNVTGDLNVWNDDAADNFLVTKAEALDLIYANVNSELINLANISDGEANGSFYTSTASTYAGSLAQGAVIFGSGTKATGANSFAVGQGSFATAPDAVAFNEGTAASGYSSAAFGFHSVASGNNSAAFGQYTEASGADSLAVGYHTTASGMDQFVCGSNNIADTEHKYAFIVGIDQSSSINSRANGFTVDWSGNGWFAGEIRVGGTGQDDNTSNAILPANLVATEKTPTTNNVINWLYE